MGRKGPTSKEMAPTATPLAWTNPGSPVTKLLYMDRLEDAYLRTFDARVVEVLPDAVVLDQSLFYPLGGGQEWDTGHLATREGREVAVREVTKRGLVRHVVGANHGLAVGDAVHGTLDWDRRYAHMRMHTAQHLVSGLAYEMFGGIRTVGNQIHAERSRIDFNPVDFTNEMLKDLESAANDAVKAQHALGASTMTRDQVLAEQPADRTNMDLLPKSVTELRVIRIGKNIDLCPCAGTHVANTKEIGEIQIVGRRSKGQGTQRVEYVLQA